MTTLTTKLDKISQNIVYLLSLDARLSITDLAKELKLTRRVVENRVKKLVDKEYVRKIFISNDSENHCFTILIKMNQFDKALIEKIQKVKNLRKVKETLGVYDISILFDAKSLDEVNQIVNKISLILDDNILTYDIIPHDYEDTLGNKSFCHDPSLLTKYKPLSSKKIKLSSRERLVIETLERNPTISLLDLSEEVNISFKTLKSILDRLTDSRIIRFTIHVNYERLGLHFHNLFLKVKIGKSSEFENYLLKHPRIHWLKKSKGRWNYILSVTARDINEFIDITKEIRSDNKDKIAEVITLISKVKEIRKY